MRWKASPIIAGASLLLFLASGTLWIRSYWWSDSIERKLVVKHAGKGIDSSYEVWHALVYTSNGGIRFIREHDQGVWFAIDLSTTFSSSRLDYWTTDYPYWTSSPPDERFRVLGFQYIVDDWLDSGATKHSASFVMPFASLTILFGIAPAAWVVMRVRSRSRSVKGFCRCGYDLRASIDRCPECGRSITRGDRAAA